MQPESPMATKQLLNKLDAQLKFQMKFQNLNEINCRNKPDVHCTISVELPMHSPRQPSHDLWRLPNPVPHKVLQFTVGPHSLQNRSGPKMELKVPDYILYEIWKMASLKKMNGLDHEMEQIIQLPKIL